MSRRLTAIALSLGLVLAPVIVLIGVLTLVDPTPAELNPPVDPIWTEPSESEQLDHQEVQVQISLGEPDFLRSPGGQGLVTEVHVTGGSDVSGGDTVAAVDGIELLGMPSAAPLYHTITWRTEGADVLDTEAFLRELGLFDDEPDNQFNAATYRAVVDFERSLGLPATGSFSPEYVIWLPLDPFPIQEVDLDVGATLPSQGSVIATSVRPTREATITTSEGASVSAPSVLHSLSIDGSPIGEYVPDDGLPSDLIARLRAAAKPTADNPELLEVSAITQRADPIARWTVPASAVMRGADAQTCVWGRYGGSHVPVSVTLIGSELGATIVEWPDSVPDEILANPVAILDDPACPSNS